MKYIFKNNQIHTNRKWMTVARGWGKGKRDLPLNGYTVSGLKKRLETHLTTMWIYLPMPSNAFKNG